MFQHPLTWSDLTIQLHDPVHFHGNVLKRRHDTCYCCGSYWQNRRNNMWFYTDGRAITYLYNCMDLHSYLSSWLGATKPVRMTDRTRINSIQFLFIYCQFTTELCCIFPISSFPFFKSQVEFEKSIPLTLQKSKSISFRDETDKSWNNDDMSPNVAKTEVHKNPVSLNRASEHISKVQVIADYIM